LEDDWVFAETSIALIGSSIASFEPSNVYTGFLSESPKRCLQLCLFVSLRSHKYEIGHNPTSHDPLLFASGARTSCARHATSPD
jgi:hypothetical protein